MNPCKPPKTSSINPDHNASGLAPPHKARIQAARPDSVLVGHPGKETFQAEAISTVRRRAIPEERQVSKRIRHSEQAPGSVSDQTTKERGNSLSLVSVPVVGFVGDAVLLVRLDQLVVVVHSHGTPDNLAHPGHYQPASQQHELLPPCACILEDHIAYSARPPIRSPLGPAGPSSCRMP